VGAQDEVTALLARDPAAHVELGNPLGDRSLVESLQQVGAWDQVTVLEKRAPQVTLGSSWYAIPRLLDGLREAGVQDLVTALEKRAPDFSLPLPDMHLWSR
jgi:hypothetical protein